MSNYSELPKAIPPELVEDFLSKLHYVSESLTGFEWASEMRDRVRFTLAAGSESEASVIATRIAEVAGKMTSVYHPTEKKVLLSRIGTGDYDADPQPLLEASGDLHRYGAGRFGLGPKLVAL
ncbi:MAG: hypothetical protein ABI882_22925, partial [Acidobacteriota bacterium]